MPDKSTTQTTRRTKYGLNVTVAILAAVALAILLNWIAHRQTQTRWDFTATRAYSLAPQTRQVLDNLDSDYRIVTLFREGNHHLTRIADLVDEYARRSSHIRAEQLNPDFDVRRRHQLNADVRNHFADELASYEQAIDQGMTALQRLYDRMPDISRRLNETLEDETFATGPVRERVQRINAAISGQQSTLTDELRALNEASDQSLPDYRLIKQTTQQLIEELDENMFRAAVQWLEDAVDAPNVPNRVKNTLISAHRDIQTLRDANRAALRELRLAEPPRRYDEAREGLSLQQAVVVIGPDTLRVIPATDMYRQTPGQQEADAQPEVRFLGEERLTGALIAMGLEQPPMVVFINSAQQPAIGQGGLYQHVAQRLRTANLRVEQWSPGGRMSPTGQSLPASPPPRPQPGQRTVWVVLPMTTQNPLAGSAGQAEVADLLTERLNAGDAAMVMLMLNPAAGMNVGDPLIDYLNDQWGLHPQLNRQILREVQLSERQTQTTGQFEVEHWPDDLPVSQALAGMRGFFVQTSPLRTTRTENVTHWPLVQLRSQRMWAPRSVDPEALRTASYDPAEADEQFPIAIAAERNGSRLMAFTDPVWASDRVTTYGRGGPGTAELVGSLFPANSELFVNSVYWLAGLEGLIAASPRTQDIRRIQAMEDATLHRYYFALLGGAPLLILAAGTTVWFIRRRA